MERDMRKDSNRGLEAREMVVSEAIASSAISYLSTNPSSRACRT